MAIRKHARSGGSPATRRSLPPSVATVVIGSVVALVVAAVAARGAWRGQGVPDVAAVSCTVTGPELEDGLVQPQPDGVHLAFDNPAGAQQFDVHAARWEVGSSVGGELGRGITRAQIGAPPGTLLITCLGDHGFTWGRPARLTVVDPTGLWISPQPACSQPRVRDVDAGVPPDEAAPASIARSVLGGLLPSDLLLKPGYPRTLWQGDLVVVVRRGRTIAAITQYADHGRWIVHVQVCPGNQLLGAP